MMPKSKQVTITMREEDYNRLRELHRIYSEGLSFPKWITYTITSIIQNNAIFYVLHVDSDTVYLENKKTNEIIRLSFNANNKTLYCTKCNKDDCLHVGFCLGNIKVITRLQG